MADAAPPTARLAWLRRRGWTLLLCLVGGWLAGLALARCLPQRYRAQALLLWRSSAGSAAGLGRQLRETLAPERLTAVLANHPALRAREQQSAGRFSRQLLAAAHLEPPNIVELSWLGPTADQAASTLAAVVALCTRPEAPASARTATSLSTVSGARARLAAAEQLWGSFASRYPDFSPRASNPAARQQTLADGISQARQALKDAQEQASQIDRQLAALSPPPQPPRRAASDHAATDQLAKLQAQLAQLRTRYTENYPDVQKLEAQIAVLRGRPVARAAPPTAALSDTTTAAWNILAAQLRARRAAAARATVAARARLAKLESEATVLARQQREAAALDSQASQLQREVRESRAALSAAVAAASVRPAPGGAGAPFILLRSPQPPPRPVFPDPRLFAAVGLLAGLAAGVALAIGRERREPRLRDQAAAARWCAAPLLPGIPPLLAPAERRWRATRQALATAAAWLLLGLVAAGNVLLYFHR